jgi:hypothetical protein
MKAVKRYLLVATTFGVALATLALFSPGVVQAVNTSLVQVVNTASSPVPTISVGVATVSGTVGVSGTVATRSVDEHARQPFQKSYFLAVTDGNFVASDASLTVPAGKRLVVQQVSAAIGIPIGQLPSIALGGQLQGQGSQVFALPVKLGQANQTTDQWLVSSPVLFYADLGSPVAITLGRNIGSGFAEASVTISGYLIDI